MTTPDAIQDAAQPAPPSRAPELPAAVGAPEDGSIEALEDLCFYGGLYGDYDVADLIEEAKHEGKKALEDQEALAQRRLEVLQDRLKDTSHLESELRRGLEINRDALEKNRTETRAVDARQELHRREQERLSKFLVQKRGSYPARLLKRKLEERQAITELTTQAWLDREEAALGLEKKAHELATERRDLNETEYSRRVNHLLERREATEVRRQNLEGILDSLRLIGITRTTYGFLIWAGYLAFTAFGWLAGEAFRKQAVSDGGFVQEIVFQLSGAIATMRETLGLPIAILIIALAPLALLGLLLGIIYLTDRFVSHFDGRWTRSPQGRSKHPHKRQSAQLLRMPGADISRADYTQLVAKLPLFYVWSTIPMGIAILFALSERASGEETSRLLTDPWQSMFFTLIGVVAAVTIAGFVLLYLCRVVQARVAAGRGGPISQNAELVVVGILLVGWIASSGTSGAAGWEIVPPWSTESVAGPLFLQLVAGFVVSYGLLYKGLNLDYRAMVRDAQDYDIEIQKYNAYPAIPLVDEEAANYRDELRDLYSQIERRWSDLEEELFSRGLLRGIRTLGRLGAPKVYLGADLILEPELVQQLEHGVSEASALAVEGEKLVQEIRNLEARIERLNRELRAVDVERHQIERTIYDEEVAARTQVARLRRYYGTLAVRLETSFKLGVNVRDQLGLGEESRLTREAAE